MVQCELCGKDTTLVNVLIEGVNLNACSDCGKHGRVITAKSTIQRDEEISEDISSDYDVKIKHARESRNLKQQECAQLLNIKESMLQKLETKKMRPSLELAKKIQSLLHISLIEKVESLNTNFSAKKSQPLTIGDIIKNKIKM